MYVIPWPVANIKIYIKFVYQKGINMVDKLTRKLLSIFKVEASFFQTLIHTKA